MNIRSGKLYHLYIGYTRCYGKSLIEEFCLLRCGLGDVCIFDKLARDPVGEPNSSARFATNIEPSSSSFFEVETVSSLCSDRCCCSPLARVDDDDDADTPTSFSNYPSRVGR